MNNKIKITMLGGLNEIGLNSAVIEVGGDIVVIDLGVNFNDGEYGINSYVPNIDLLKAKRDKIRGILVTHGHYDHRAAIPFLIDKIGYPPVYGSAFTIKLIRQQLRQFRKDKSAKLVSLHPRQEVNLGKIHVKAIHLTHSIVGNFGYFLKTTGGNIFHSSDFKFDDTPFHEKPTDYQSLHQAGKEGVLVGMIDSTRANRSGHSRSETAITRNLEKLIRKSQGRIIVSTFAQMLSRINQVALLGKKHGREIFIKGRTLEKTTKIGLEMGILDKGLQIKDSRKMKNYPDGKILLFATGSQGEEKAALNRMLDADRGIYKIKPTDTIILSSSSIPENIVAIQELVDSFASRGCQVYTDDVIDIHAGGHGHREEIKKMIEIIKPKFVFPIEGYVSFRQQLARLAYSMGYKKNQVILPKNNQAVIVHQNGFKKLGGKVKKPSVVIQDLVIPDGISIVEQRKKIAKEGILYILINGKTKNVKLASIGVPNLVMKQARKIVHRKNLTKNSKKDAKKILLNALMSEFPRDMVPVIKVESV